MGWRYDKEDQKFLREQATRFRYLTSAQIPEKVDPRGKIRIKDQGQVGACSGFSRAYCMEALNNGIGQTGLLFSEMFGYLTGQKEDGLLGRDTGATISGGIKASRKYGNAPQQLFPFPNRYTTDVPESCYPAAEKHQLLAHAPLRTAEEARQAIGSGFPIYLGIIWGREMDSPVVDNFSGQGGGGHALALLGYEGDYLIGPNSWSEKWGDRGWFKWHMRAVDQMIRSRNSEFFVVSEIEDPTPREWNYQTDLILG